MADSTSPYAAPSTGPVENLSTMRVAQGQILGQSPMVLPDEICVACSRDDAPGSSITQDLVYVPIWMTLIVLGSCVVYIAFPIALIAYFFVRKRMRVTYFMCKTCRRHRRRKVALALIVGVGILALTVVGYDLMPDKGWLVIIGVVALLVAVFVAANKTRDPLRVGRNEGEFALRNLPGEYLEQLTMKLDTPDEMIEPKSS